MKALTLYQPWASLVAVGAKRIETRSWSTSYRGPLAIHAARRPLDLDGLRLWQSDPVRGPGGLPLGAVVATCTLADCLPIVAEIGCSTGRRSETGGMITVSANGKYVTRFTWSFGCSGRQLSVDKDESNALPVERPYGDFTPGRFAWLLADVVKLDEPVPARGRQGLWEWTP